MLHSLWVVEDSRLPFLLKSREVLIILNINRKSAHSVLEQVKKIGVLMVCFVSK